MRGPLPLSDADFAEVRAAVLARISRRTPYAWYLAFAASVVVAVMSVVVARQPIVVQPVSHHVVIPSVARDLGERVARRTPSQVPRYARHDKPHRKHPTPQLARIEIHTADPDVRIIWITN